MIEGPKEAFGSLFKKIIECYWKYVKMCPINISEGGPELC